MLVVRFTHSRCQTESLTTLNGQQQLETSGWEVYLYLVFLVVVPHVEVMVTLWVHLAALLSNPAEAKLPVLLPLQRRLWEADVVDDCIRQRPRLRQEALLSDALALLQAVSRP